MGFSSKCVVFDGSNDYVTMGNVLGYERTNAFSVSYWAKVSVGANGFVVAKQNSLGYGWGCLADYSGAKSYLQLQSATGQVYVSAPVPSDGAWHHIVWTYDGSSAAAGCSCFVDGQSVTVTTVTDTLSATIVNTGALVLGARNGASSFYKGRLDEIAIYGRELSLAEAQWLYNAGSPCDLTPTAGPDGLAAWWRMGEGDTYPTLLDSGASSVPPTVRDLSGNNYTGTMTNMESTDVVLDAPGRGMSVIFDGVDDYATAGNQLDRERNLPISWSMWFKTTATTGWLLAKMDGATTYRGYGVYMTGGKLFLSLRSDAATSNEIYVGTTSAFNDGEWHHLVWTYDGASTAAGCKCYLDGVLQTTSVVTDNLSATIANSSPLFLAARPTGGLPAYSTPFAGQLDEVAMYNKELSGSEVTWIYNSGVPNDIGNFLYSPSSYWRMGEGATFPAIPDLGSVAANGTLTNMESGDITSDTAGGDSSLSCNFGGTDEYMDCGNVHDLSNSLANESWSCWFKTSATTPVWLMAKADSNFGTTLGYRMGLTSTGAMRFERKRDGTAGIDSWQTATGFNDGNWHHVLFTHYGVSGVYIFVDGVSMSLSSTVYSGGTSTTNSVAFTVGAMAAGSGAAVVEIDEVSVFTYQLGVSAAMWFYNSGAPRYLLPDAPTGLWAWWRMGDGDVFSTLKDRSAFWGYDQTMTNMYADDIIGDSPGLVSDFDAHCLEFGGTNEYVNAGNILGFERTDAFSVSYWFKANGTGGYVVSKMDSGPAGWGAYQSPSAGVQFFLINNVSTNLIWVNGPTNVNDNYWHHVVWTYDGSSAASGVKCYVDGVLRSTTVSSDNLSATILNSGNLNIGSRTGGTAALVGRLDEVAVYAKELSLAEVQWIYNFGIPKNLKYDGSPSDLDAWWRLGEGAYPGTMTNMDASDIVFDAPGVFSAQYIMRGIDSGAGYVVWHSAPEPDWAGVGYPGGYPAPVGAMVAGSAVVINEWYQ
jgi:hypothetical protein